MRSIFLALALFTACASTGGANRPVNVASVRHEINDAIKSHENDRAIHSMGKVTAQRAVVYTTNKSGAKQEETWVKDSSGWKLEGSTALAGSPTSASTN